MKTPMQIQRKCKRKIYKAIAGHRKLGNFRVVKLLRKAMRDKFSLLLLGGMS